MARVLIFGAAWVTFLIALVVFSNEGGMLASLAPAPPNRGARYPGWTVTRAYSAHHAMVVEVESETATGGADIAAQIVEPLKSRYDEVLIYIRLPNQRRDDLPARRIQWTPRAGYVELSLRRD